MVEKREPVTTVVRRVTAAVGIPGELVVPLSAEFCYDMADPYAVRLSFSTLEIEPVVWVFARLLLEEGMHRPVGVGSVLVSPPHWCHRDFMRIVLRSRADEGAARIEVPSVEVGEFLRRSYTLVPPGAESLHVDVDRALAALMDRCE
ncbi:hypothetical protein ADL25_07670 [Streptomyces sp. NRRL F-5122]|nr:hypothetical protein ADL25_07670 [Streptomyces sp. NRRL F-5122]